MFNQDLLDHIAICNEQHFAKAVAIAFDAEKLVAGGKVENTIERAYVKPIGHRNTITGWIVLVEKRDLDCVGQPWPARPQH